MPSLAKRAALNALQYFFRFGGKIGGDADSFEIEPDGSIKLNGKATVFEDLPGTPSAVKVVGVGVSVNDAEQTIVFTNSADLNDYIWSSYQMKHKWKFGSYISPHAHAEQASVAVPNILMRYRWQKQGTTKTTDWTDYKCNTPAFAYSSGTLNQVYHGAGLVPPAGYGLSDIIQIRTFRDNANASGLFSGADSAPSTISITFTDVHLEIDSLGSRTEYTK